MKKQLQATSVKRLLTTTIVALILVAGGGFYLAVQQIKSFAVTTNHTAADAEASERNIEKLQELKQSLAQSESLVEKSNKLFATEATYQSQALKDVQRYATTIGLTISSTNFDSNPASTGRSFSIALQSPVNYEKLIRFLDAIEGNLPKMQIQSMKISRSDAGTASDVDVSDITIGISTR